VVGGDGMRILVIDANRIGVGPPCDPGTQQPTVANPKWRAAKLLGDALEADMTWRSPTRRDEPILDGYDVLVFNRALPEIDGNAAWLRANPNARIFHLTNDYLVGGTALYIAARALGKTVHVIANHPRHLSQSGMAFVEAWTELNLNTLVYEADRTRPSEMPTGEGCVYYGAYRPEREDMFRKYLTGHVTLALMPAMRPYFDEAGVPGPRSDQVDWRTTGLYPWHASLYIWNVAANGHYRFLTNRFYEALGYEVWPIFTEETRWIFSQSGYYIPPALVVHHPDEILQATAYDDADVMATWRAQAQGEQQRIVAQMRDIIRGN